MVNPGFSASKASIPATTLWNNSETIHDFYVVTKLALTNTQEAELQAAQLELSQRHTTLEMRLKGS